MAVNSTHSKYDKKLPIWRKCVSTVDGQDAIHAAKTDYLSKLKDESDEDYKARLERTTFFNATGRTVDGLVGMVMRKEPTIERTEGFATYLDDVDLQGTDINEFINSSLYEVLQTNRIGLLVEYPPGVSGGTVAQVESLNIRPYIAKYEAQTIINWKVKRINNQMMLVMLVLEEEYEIPKDEYTSDCKKQYRVLTLEQIGYVQRLYRENAKGDWVQEGDDIIPLKKGNPLPYIPFVLLGQHKNFDPVNPIILDLVNLNLAHYRVNADYEHGCHFTGLPTPVVSGYQTSDTNTEKFMIGSTTAWVFPDPQAKASFLEFTGQGLGALKENLDSKKQEMAVLGARIIEDQKSGVEAFQTAQLRANGENSALASVAKMVAKQLSQVLTIMAEWSGMGEVKVQLNTDYYPVSMTAQDLTALVQAWQSNAISKETLFYNLKQGEIIAETVTFEEEQDRIDSQAPTLVNANG